LKKIHRLKHLASYLFFIPHSSQVSNIDHARERKNIMFNRMKKFVERKSRVLSQPKRLHFREIPDQAPYQTGIIMCKSYVKYNNSYSVLGF